MDKLKTLKDLQKDYKWKYDTYVGLRKEVIKWIKFIDNCYPYKKDKEEFCLFCGKTLEEHKGKKCNKGYDRDYLTNYAYDTSDYDGAIKILRYIFNITEEDLKDG